MKNMSDETHDKCIQDLMKAQDAETDQREQAREAHLFVDKKDGQWEPYWWNANSGKPRYTFDLTSPIVDQIAGEMELANFSIKVSPAGGDASKETALLLDGMVRNIENISSATDIYNQSARNMVTSGADGWRVTQKYVSDNSFDQDLVIEPIHNFLDRCWFDVGSEQRDRSDAKKGWVLSGLTPEAYKSQFPDGAGQSVSSDREDQAYFYRPDLIMVGEYYYIEQVERELVLMSNGAVLEANDDLEKVIDELAQSQIVEVNRRSRMQNKVYVRKFDAGGWLSEPQETVFSYIPLIPTYANYKVVEDKTIYSGVVEKLLDPQRVLNYSLSREIEEGALAPRAKYWMTRAQASGNEATLATLNTNNDPVQFYQADSEAPPPQQTGGAVINQGLRAISAGMQQLIGQSVGLFAANMGDNPGLQSGVAIKSLQRKGDTGMIKYFKAQEVAIQHTGKILIDAIPKIYDTDRMVRILKEDGSSDMEQINHTIIDQQTGESVVLNDLSVGVYDVIASSGASFQNRQEESNAALLEMAAIDPSIIEMSGDIMLKNVSAPGMNVLAERKRMQLLESGAIPEEQWTEEEQQKAAEMEAEGAESEPSADMVAAQAEMQKAQAEMQKVEVASAKNQLEMQKIQVTAQKNQADAQLTMQKQQFEMQKAQTDAQNAAQKQQLDFRDQEITIAEKTASAELDQQKFDFNKFMERQEQQTAQNTAIINALKTQAETAKIIKETVCGGVTAISIESPGMGKGMGPGMGMMEKMNDFETEMEGFSDEENEFETEMNEFDDDDSSENRE